MSQRGANSSYFGNIGEAISSLLTGLKLSFRHLWQARQKREPMGVAEDNYFERQNGIVTLQYPHEKFPVPDVGRYQLHNEIDDCIVCDKCAKICPVDCIEIEPIRATEEIGKTSDGSSKRIYAATFDIDMAKCCFCGLCTTVCPTECLTMTKEYDFSVFDIQEHTFAFSEMTETEIAEKKQEFEVYQKQKAADKASRPKPNPGARPKVGGKSTFKPKMPVIKRKPNQPPSQE
ncbi:MAG: 4Fe-4S binding protein [Tunicatimonas sp.]|uniref:4Fe-4S binding protein n=1 Tax=Tunicatimonas sp. TaxID=1940096 RepID=UPI003C750DC8